MYREPPHGFDEELDAAYRAKYRRYAVSIVNHIVPLRRDPRRSNSCRAPERGDPDRRATIERAIGIDLPAS